MKGMKKIITCLLTFGRACSRSAKQMLVSFRSCLLAALAMLGLTTACGQANYENVDVKGFAKLMNDPNVVVLDVRTAEEFGEGHLVGAINIDQAQSSFIEKAKAVKCRPSMIILDTIKSKGYAPGEGIKANHSMAISHENEEYAISVLTGGAK